MAKKKHPEIVLSNQGAVDSAAKYMQGVFQNETVKDGRLYQMKLVPYGAPKTYKQIAAIHALCKELSTEDDLHGNRFSKDWWYKEYKLWAYIPLLKIQALEDGDEQLVSLINDASKLIKKSLAARIGFEDDDYSIKHFIADNPAFSYEFAKKEHLIEVINYMLDDAPKRGIYLELKTEDE